MSEFTPVPETELLTTLVIKCMFDESVTRVELRSLAFYMLNDMPPDYAGTSIHLALLSLRDGIELTEADHVTIDQYCHQSQAAIMLASAQGEFISDEILAVVTHLHNGNLALRDGTIDDNSSELPESDDAVWSQDDELDAFLESLYESMQGSDVDDEWDDVDGWDE